MTVEEIIELANRRIEETHGTVPVTLDVTIDHNLVLRVFEGNRWTGGIWKKVAETGDDVFFGKVKSRKTMCSRKYVLQKDSGNIDLTPCGIVKCIAETAPGRFVDYTRICDMRG